MTATHSHLTHTAAAVCECGAMCAGDRPGHGLTVMRNRLAEATPAGWRDAVVQAVHAGGSVELLDWADDTPFTVWHHADVREAVRAGDLVALHTTYSVLAAGAHRFNVAG